MGPCCAGSSSRDLAQILCIIAGGAALRAAPLFYPMLILILRTRMRISSITSTMSRIFSMAISVYVAPD